MNSKGLQHYPPSRCLRVFFISRMRARIKNFRGFEMAHIREEKKTRKGGRA